MLETHVKQNSRRYPGNAAPAKSWEAFYASFNPNTVSDGDLWAWDEVPTGKVGIIIPENRIGRVRFTGESLKVPGGLLISITPEEYETQQKENFCNFDFTTRVRIYPDGSYRPVGYFDTEAAECGLGGDEY